MQTSSPGQSPVYAGATDNRIDQPAARRRGPRPATWFLLAWCLVVWPAVFASVVVATFIGVAIYYNDFGGPLWPFLVWIGSAILYALAVGIPLSICAHRRRWYLRLIPAVLIAVPVVWIISQVGVWAIPGTVTIAASILVETFRLRLKLLARARPWLTDLWRRL